MSKNIVDFDLFCEVDKILHLIKASNFFSDNLFQGTYNSIHKGGLYNFESYTSYVPGMDVRQIDWNLWGKTDKLFVKEYLNETNINVSITLDSSKSMRTIFESNNKWFSLLRLASALSYIFIKNKEKVSVNFLKKENIDFLPFKNSMQHFYNIISMLQNSVDEKNMKKEFLGDISISFEKLLMLTNNQRNFFFIFSDFFSNNINLLKSLKKLDISKNNCVFIHFLSEVEIKLFKSGKRYKFIDSETKEDIEVSMSGVEKNYYKIFSNWQQEIKEKISKAGFRYLFINSDDNPLDNIRKIINIL